MAIADAHGFPVAVCTESAQHHEIKLVERTINHKLTENNPKRLIGDKAYDSDALDKILANEYDIELISPHKSNRIKKQTQDGRKLRRYKKRWKVERLFAWFNNYRRIIVRWDYHISNFLGFVHLACIMILLKLFMR